MPKIVTFRELFDALQLLKSLEPQEIPKKEIILRIFNNGGAMCSVSLRDRLYRLKTEYLNGRTLKQIKGARIQTDFVRVLVVGNILTFEYGSSIFLQRIVVPDGYVCEIYTNFRHRFKKAFIDTRHKLTYL